MNITTWTILSLLVYAAIGAGLGYSFGELVTSIRTRRSHIGFWVTVCSILMVGLIARIIITATITPIILQ